MIPAYNEEARILPTLQQTVDYLQSQPYTWEIVVVSDGSTDRTEPIVREFGQGREGVRLLNYSPNRGKGYAVRVGMLDGQGERLLFADADLATPPEETQKLMRMLDEGYELAIGSRPLRESRLEVRQPWWREAFGRTANKLIQLLGVRGIRDTQCGFKMFRQDAAKEIFSRVKLTGFSFDVEALMIARDLGYRIAEVPIRWRDQKGSKVVLWRDAPKALFDLVRLRLMGKRKRLALRER